MPTINTQIANTYSWLGSSSSTTNTSSANAEQFSVETKDIQSIKKQIKTWVDDPSKKPNELRISNSESDLYATPTLELMNIYNKANSLVWENSQKYSNVSEAQYNEAKDYLFNQIDEILLSTYLEEGGSDFFKSLLYHASIRNGFNVVDETYKNIETSAVDFVYASKSGNAGQILQATTKLDEDLTILMGASIALLPNLTNFFALVEDKIPENELQKIIDSLSVMQSYSEDTFSIQKTGSITLKNGTIIRASVDENDRVSFEVILPQDKMDGLVSNYINENFQTLLQILKHQENLLEKQKQAKVTMSNDLLAKLMKMSLDEKFGADIN